MANGNYITSESTVYGISVRAIIVLTLILVFCITVFVKITNETLNSIVMAVIGWYFGQKGNGNGNGNGNGYSNGNGNSNGYSNGNSNGYSNGNGADKP